MGLWRCLVGFMLGTLACVIWQAARSPRAWPWALFAAGWIALGSVAGWPETAIVPPAIVTAMLALTYAKGPLARFLSSRAAVWLGEVSYSTYLAHAFLFLVFKLLFVDASLQIGWAGLAAYLLLLLIASWTLYRLIEKPAQRWLNARTPGWTRPLPASPQNSPSVPTGLRPVAPLQGSVHDGGTKNGEQRYGEDHSATEIKALAGTIVGTSEWVEVSQEQINQFAEATGDFQFIHVDEEKAKLTPFGGTIAHGFLTLSLIPLLTQLSDCPRPMASRWA
jgi:hypothetical protein